jgi:uncharacterized protein YcbX
MSPGPVRASAHAGRARQLWRYPIKSLAGERLVPSRSTLAASWETGSGRCATRTGSSAAARRPAGFGGWTGCCSWATYDGDVPVVVFPDGCRIRGDDVALAPALSAHVGRPVSLGKETMISHFDEGPLHLITAEWLAEIGRVSGRDAGARRFRANLVVEAEAGASRGRVDRIARGAG